MRAAAKSEVKMLQSGDKKASFKQAKSQLKQVQPMAVQYNGNNSSSSNSSSNINSAQSRLSRITKFGEVTGADGRPLERISTRPMTPVQPLVAEMKDDSDQNDSDNQGNRDHNNLDMSFKTGLGNSEDSELDDQDEGIGQVMQSMHSASSGYRKSGGSGNKINGTGSGGQSPNNLYHHNQSETSIHYSSPVKFSSNSPLKVSSIECPTRHNNNNNHNSNQPVRVSSPRSNVMAAFAKLDPKFSSPSHFISGVSSSDTSPPTQGVRSSPLSPRSSKRPEELIPGEDDVDDLVSTIFLISDDERLKVFGTTYCFNGRDSFK